MYIYILAFLAFGFIITKIISPLLVDCLKNNNMIRKNYIGDNVISGMGLIIFASLLMLYSIGSIILSQMPSIVFLFGCTIVTLIGLLDDIWGDNLNKGLKGHFKALLQGSITTGCIKAIVGLMTAALISRTFSSNLAQLLLNTSIVALNINSINLFDLRPGRAVKYFLFSIAIVTSILGINNSTIWLFGLLGSIIYYAPLDLQGKVMLGDTGSNLLGFILGYYMALIPSDIFKLFCLIYLVVIHWYSEKKSISSLIAEVRVLWYLDSLGRPKA